MTILKITFKKTTGNTPIVFSHTKYSIYNIIATNRYRKLLKAAYLSHFLNLICQVFFLDTLAFTLFLFHTLDKAAFCHRIDRTGG